MTSSRLHRVVSVLALLPVVLSAQKTGERNQVPLKQWAAPLYWQPSQREVEALFARPETLATAAFYTPTTPLLFVGITPCRIVDTRADQGFSGAFGPPILGANASRTFPLQSSTACSIPVTALAYSMNVTVVPPGIVGYITMYPTGQPLPLAATLTDAAQGNILSNSAIVPAGTNGSIDVYAQFATDLVIDINGYYVSLSYGDGSDYNIALGYQALQSNTTGSSNTATGARALASNTTGPNNTATGAQALENNTGGGSNTADGITALESNTTGYNNTAVGAAVLMANTTGHENTAIGVAALGSNTTGTSNIALGAGALDANTTGFDNIAIGRDTANFITVGNYNVALGDAALAKLTTATGNTAIGHFALFNATGTDNIGLGYNAGSGVTGSNNIEIGHPGFTSDNGTIRIGSQQQSFFVAAVRGVTTGNSDAVPVVIDSNGQLGTVNSSRRFKEDIQDMGRASSGLLRLRPVTFRYQKPFADGSKPIQYGLIAEEVEEVYPDLVAHSADGQIETVKYQVLDSMLLNEVQRQHAEIVGQNDQIRALEKQLKEQQERMAKMESVLSALSDQARVQ